MDVHWQDLEQRLEPGVWCGLQLTVTGTNGDGFCVDVCPPKCIRIAISRRPLLWARIDEDHYGYDLLRAPGLSSIDVIPPMPFGVVNDISSSSAGFAADRAWACAYAEMLAASNLSPLSTGRWHLGHYGRSFNKRSLSPELIRAIVNQKTQGYVVWDFGLDIYPITLRDMSRPDNGRVKAWRKHARGGTLPPVLLHWVSGLAAYVVLDGHDRLLAASLENVDAPALSLEPLREYEISSETKNAILAQLSKSLELSDRERAKPPGERLARAQRLMDVDRANELLLNAFVPDLGAGPSRARPLKGGLRQWTDEVRTAVSAHRLERSSLLDGLDP